MLYRMNDGTLYKADTPKELVRIMHETSFAPAEDDETWMEEVAKRTWQQTGTPVRFGTAREFIEDLIHIGLMKEENVS